jgi:hypothetical protein
MAPPRPNIGLLKTNYRNPVKREGNESVCAAATPEVSGHPEKTRCSESIAAREQNFIPQPEKQPAAGALSSLFEKETMPIGRAAEDVLPCTFILIICRHTLSLKA